MKNSSILIKIILALCFVLIFGSFLGGAEVHADSIILDKVPRPLIANQRHEGGCLTCHSHRSLVGKTKNGESVSLFFDSSAMTDSVHSPTEFICEDCHTDYSDYPHRDEDQIACVECHGEDVDQVTVNFDQLEVKLPYDDSRSMSIALNDGCQSCHDKEFLNTVESIHSYVLMRGNPSAPVCVDCHGSHDVTPPGEPRSRISTLCAECHKSVYSSYQVSVHGAALENESNPDVPTCVDCHGTHKVRGPRDLSFRNDSFLICGDCHSNELLMGKYGISTDVFETYLDDFHGRTVNLFRLNNKNVPSNKALCYDCHGIHNIRKSDDPLSQVYPENLQDTCQQCHESANIQFPDSWLSHYVPTLDDNPVLFLVNAIYIGLISITLGGFVFYILIDAKARWRLHRKPR